MERDLTGLLTGKPWSRNRGVSFVGKVTVQNS